MLVRTRPYRPAFAFDRAFDRAFDQLTSSFFTAAPRTPVVDAGWRDGSLVLTADLPGTPADQIDVSVSGRMLTISAKSETSSWERSVRIGEALDPDQVSASYVDGRLTVTVGAIAKPEPRKIEVSSSGPESLAESSEAQPENGTSDNS